MDYEERMKAALAKIESSEEPNYTAIAKEYKLTPSTLIRRAQGKTTSREEFQSQVNQCLSNEQERILIKQINRLTERGIPPTSQMVRNFAEEMIGRAVGKNWSSQFCQRHQSELKSLYLRNIENLRVKGEYGPTYKLFFDLLRSAIEDNNITAENVYNWDEKGFMIGIMRAMKRIMGKGAYKSGRVRQAAHDGNREFITLLACISAIGKKIPASLLYTGESYDLQNTWVQDLEDDDDFFFGASSNGWTCDAYGLKWLTDVFEPATRPTSPRTKRLLIVDGHSSHVNMAFINKCWELRIILLIFPPHSTHRLQPLDVVLFGLLSLAYHKELNAFNVRGLGMVPMKKKNFLKLFRPAWRISFTEENILKAFAKPGIWPYDPALVLNVITRPITPPPAIQPAPSSIDRLKTPRSAKSIRHFQADYRKNPTRAKLEKLFKANEELAAQAALDRWTTVGLIEALKDEKKSRARGKRLNVLGEEHTGPILFSAENVRRAQERFAEKEAFEKSERIRIDTKKAETAAKKQKAEVENAEKALQAAAREDNIEQVRVEEKAEKQAQKKKEAAQIKALKALPVRIKAPTKARKAPVVKKKVVRFVGGDIEGQGVETPAKQSSRGRAIKPRVIFESGSNQ